ncbi:tRNA threonylcarbamoyladenosine biosynthesis protein [Lysinibacillus sp. BF-4]|uniref:L-threonylcarbamoyladenylate synthase n=1 Tax=Lysinibacillus sp. BF-4 TaxID=1473546 RepID=UPI00050848E7|nr:L-threonylcarbamoyladenylate synthase [Lysinibacillus sp. BF-4]KFL43123.1 tRNA threonylcarbamoyladenosine biosynthesis protein [Lysinibacillus sp. BF-4]
METHIAAVNSIKAYEQAATLLQDGQLVAFPTETVYGLGAIATNAKAVAAIFEAKGRPSDNPLIVHIGTKQAVEQYCTNVSTLAKQCMASFWPGPLTLVMQAKPNTLATNVTAGLSTVGVRMPDHPVALQLLQTVNAPVAAPSANRSGKPSPTRASHVYDDLVGRIPLILDGGRTGIGLESTVLDVTQHPPVILRPGGVTKEMLEQVIGEVKEAKLTDAPEAPRAPGMKYTHYAPNAPVYLIEESTEKITAALTELAHERVALIAPASCTVQAPIRISLGESADIAVNLYDALRECDKTDATIILVTATTTEGVGTAIMNRLEKAAGGRWYKTTV